MSPEFEENRKSGEEAAGEDATATSYSDLNSWKEEVRRDFQAWLDSIDEIPSCENETTEDPDLYSFYEQLAVLNAEGRKANRRAAEAFAQWGSVLERFEADLRLFHEQLSREPDRDGEKEEVSKKYCLDLIELLDRLLRLQAAFDSLAPGRHWWRPDDSSWRRAWEAQREACNILVAHFETLLAREGVEHIHCLGQAFDPKMMVAAGAEWDPAALPNTVIEEIARGYLRRGELLRCAQVKVNKPQP
jgi:molecular chaperone GrpE